MAWGIALGEAVLRRPIVRAGRPLSQGGWASVRIRSGSAWKNRVSLRRILSRLGKAQTSLALRSLLQNLPPTKRGCTRNANSLGDCTGGGSASPDGCAGGDAHYPSKGSIDSRRQQQSPDKILILGNQKKDDVRKTGHHLNYFVMLELAYLSSTTARRLRLYGSTSSTPPL